MTKTAVLVCVLLGMALPQGALQGDLGAHDPSRVVKGDDGNYYYFCTGPLLPIRYSKDLTHWKYGPGLLKAIPEWAKAHVPKGRNDVWAPDVLYVPARKEWVAFYSYSTFGSKRSSIGAITSPKLTLDAEWKDAGEVISTDEKSNFNAIDPGPVLDEKGRIWMSLGSWNTGIKLVEIDAKTLKPIGDPTAIAGGRDTDMEAAFLWKKGDYFYLFYNQGFCCRGLDSTYRILMGRSKSVKGPYLDKAGVNCFDEGGGTLLMETKGDRIGPGHAAISPDGKLFSFHFYDKKKNGWPTFDWGQIEIDRDGWPVVKDLR